MGWGTYLKINGKWIQTWWSHASPRPQILFDRNDVHVRRRRAGPSVIFRTSAGQALVRLEQGGFSWPVLVDDYRMTRPDLGMATAFIEGYELGGGKTDVDVAQLRDFYQLHDHEAELRAFGAWMADSRIHELAQPKSTLGPADFLSDDEVPPTFDRIAEFLMEARARGLARSMEYFAWLRHEVPLLAWPLALVALLHEVESTSVVELDLSEDAATAREYNEELSVEEYVERYWGNAVHYWQRSARFYGRILTQMAAATTAVGSGMLYGRLDVLLRSVSETRLTARQKGQLLEDLIASLVEASGDELRVIEKRVVHKDEELDLVLANNIPDPFWIAMQSPLFIVECKNWSAPVGVPELRVLESKMRDRGRLCRVGILVALNGVTKSLAARLRDLQAQGLTIFVLDRTDLEGILARRVPVHEYLRVRAIQRLL